MRQGFKKKMKRIKRFDVWNWQRRKHRRGRKKNLIKLWLLDLLISTADEWQKPILAFLIWPLRSKLSNFINQIMLLKCNYLKANGCKIVANNTLNLKINLITLKNYNIWKRHAIIYILSKESIIISVEQSSWKNFNPNPNHYTWMLHLGNICFVNMCIYPDYIDCSILYKIKKLLSVFCYLIKIHSKIFRK